MAKSKKLIIFFYVTCIFCNSSFSQIFCSEYKGLFDSLNIGKFRHVYLYADSNLTKQEMLFGEWFHLKEKNRELTGMDSVRLSILNLQESLECFDSSIQRISYEEFRKLNANFLLSKKDTRLMQKNDRLLRKWLRIMQKNEFSRRLELLNKRMSEPKYSALKMEIAFQKPMLIIPYRIIHRDNFIIASFSTIHNGIMNTYHSITFSAFQP